MNVLYLFSLKSQEKNFFYKKILSLWLYSSKLANFILNYQFLLRFIHKETLIDFQTPTKMSRSLKNYALFVRDIININHACCADKNIRM